MRLTLLILLLPVFCFGQEMALDETTDRIIFSEVVQVEGVNADQLYSRARQWFAETYKSSESVLDLQDATNHKLIGKAWSQIYIEGYMAMTVPIKMWYTIKLFMKDGRYKYDITDIYYEGEASQHNGWKTIKNPCEMFLVGDGYYRKNGKPRPLSVSYSDNTVSSVKNLAASLKSAMEKGSAYSASEEDW